MEPAPTPPPAMPAPAPPPMASDAGYGAAHGKADLGKRFVAALIDGIISGVVAMILGALGVRAYGLGMLVGAAYIMVRDGLALDFMDGRSIGKKLMKLRPIRLNGEAMTIEASVRRNWTLALGSVFVGLGYLLFGWTGFFLLSALSALAGLLALAEAILVLTDAEGRRIGDKMAETQVIDAGS